MKSINEAHHCFAFLKFILLPFQRISTLFLNTTILVYVCPLTWKAALQVH